MQVEKHDTSFLTENIIIQFDDRATRIRKVQMFSKYSRDSEDKIRRSCVRHHLQHCVNQFTLVIPPVIRLYNHPGHRAACMYGCAIFNCPSVWAVAHTGAMCELPMKSILQECGSQMLFQLLKKQIVFKRLTSDVIIWLRAVFERSVLMKRKMSVKRMIV